MSLAEICNREDHIDAHWVEKCPKCGSAAFGIQESLAVTDYCDKIHLADALECYQCDSIITLELLLRLLKAEKAIECKCGGVQKGIELCECRK